MAFKWGRAPDAGQVAIGWIQVRLCRSVTEMRRHWVVDWSGAVSPRSFWIREDLGGAGDGLFGRGSGSRAILVGSSPELAASRVVTVCPRRGVGPGRSVKRAAEESDGSAASREREPTQVWGPR